MVKNYFKSSCHPSSSFSPKSPHPIKFTSIYCQNIFFFRLARSISFLSIFLSLKGYRHWKRERKNVRRIEEQRRSNNGIKLDSKSLSKERKRDTDRHQMKSSSVVHNINHFVYKVKRRGEFSSTIKVSLDCNLYSAYY